MINDNAQKTWVPEGTREYKQFKLITDENAWLAKILRQEFSFHDHDLVLDVGGRLGDIAFSVQKPEFVHIVDPDPTITIRPTPSLFWNCRIQEADLADRKYSLILCSHVLGYLGHQDASQKQVIEKLLPHLDENGSLILFYNTNTDYMQDLLKFSFANVSGGHYDYFDETILSNLQNSRFSVCRRDVSFELNYRSFDTLARCCWFLFGARAPDIEATAAKFLPKLEKDLPAPSFSIAERMVVVTNDAGKKPIKDNWKAAVSQLTEPVWTDFFSGAKHPSIASALANHNSPPL